MKIITNAKADRKPLVKAMSTLLQEKPHYCFTPSFAFEFSIGTLDKEAVLHLTPSLNAEAAWRFAGVLSEYGFTCAVCEDEKCSEIEPADNEPASKETADKASRQETGETEELGAAAEPSETEQYYTVYIDKASLSEATLAKLEAVIAGKASLLRKALGAENLSILQTPAGYAFPWFQIESTEEERGAYDELVRKLVAFASGIARATATDKPTDNEKYAFRCWLLRLGFIGAQYKRHRSILMRNLNGHAAFKCGYDPRSHKAKGEQRLNRPA